MRLRPEAYPICLVRSLIPAMVPDAVEIAVSEYNRHGQIL